MSLLARKLSRCTNLLFINRDSTMIHVPVVCFAARNTFVPTIFDSGEDPGPKFFSPDVQTLLKRLTRADFAKVFRKRISHSTTLQKWQRLKPPQYKFLTTEQLEEEIAAAQKKADHLLQMPPVIQVRKPVDKTLSSDVALTGFDTVKYLFTDISFGLTNENRLIVERDTDGTLRYADHDTRKRLNQAYFPMAGRRIRDPPMFTDDEKFYSLLDREEYEFVLNRACMQYDPDEPKYQEITSLVYQHIDNKKNYNLLRSTRHFGPLAFYLAWHRSVDGLLLELLQTGHVREAVCVVALRHQLHGDIVQGDEVVNLATKIIPSSTQPQSYEKMTQDDTQLDKQCIECIARYVANNSAMKGLQELALQSCRETHKQHAELSRGLRKAHGNA